MTVVKKITVENVRSHDKFELKLSPSVTVITGDNGSGKTSLLEAIYIALRGTSFKGSDLDLLKYDNPWWRIELEFDSRGKHFITFDPSLESKRKKFSVDGVTSYRLPPKNKYPVVLFEPDDLRLLHGSPARRRRFIDVFVSQLDPQYASSLHKYERALKQRNNLLKKRDVQKDDLFVWDIAISEHGSYLIEKRVAFVEHINTKLNDLYGVIAKTNDVVMVHYSHTYIGDIKQKLLNDLNKNLDRDTILGFTSVGPHRHDIVFKFNDYPAIDVASRGEVRSIVLALKFLEVEIIEQIVGKKPIVLLDDVFSELDESRQKRLLSAGNQIVITSTKLPSDIGVKLKTVNINRL